MRLVKRDLGEFAKVEIVGLADLHIGHPQATLVPVQREIEWVKAQPNRFAILLGDLTEMALRDSYGEIYQQKIDPEAQKEAVADLFAPIADRILGCVSGNHEERVRVRTGIDVANNYASRLGCPYDPGSMVVAVRFGPPAWRAPYFFLYFTHGWGAPRTLIKFKQPAELKQLVSNADVYLTAHTHQPVNYPLDTFEIDPVHLTVQRRTQRFVTVGSSLDHAEYAERKGLAPTTLEYPKIELSCHHRGHGGGSRKEIVVRSA